MATTLPTMQINGRSLGGAHSCYFIAEAGVNHNGELDLAMRLVDAALEAGADAVKFQAFDPDLLVSSDTPQAEYQTKNLGIEQSQHAMLSGLALSRKDFQHLAQYCHQQGIAFLCTPFDWTSAELVMDLGCPAIKVGSGDLTNHLFLRMLAAFKAPLILSTGMATLAEVNSALGAIRECEWEEVALLHCVSDYPAAPEAVNLRAMATMEERFGRPVGLSDHTMGVAISLAAVALGACMIEKHLTLDRSMPGPDHSASLETEDFRRLVAEARMIEKAMGNGIKEPSPGEAAVACVVRRSVAAACAIPAGTSLQEKHLTALRPATGIPADQWKNLIGRRTTCDIRFRELFSEEHFQ